MTDTILAHEHNERCRHTDCVGECCEPCANMPKAEARRPKVGDRVRIRAGVLIGNEYPLQPATVTKVTLMGGFCARPDTNRVGSCDEWGNYLPSDRGTMWEFLNEEPATKRPDGLTEQWAEALELLRSTGSVLEWWQLSCLCREEWLKVRDRAEQLFKAKADERVKLMVNEVERRRAWWEEYALGYKAERDELARKLEGAKAEGRREAFAEAENQYRHLCDCKFHPWH